MPPVPAPTDDQISVAFIPLDESGADWEDYAAGLPSEEQQRTERFHFDADRLRFAKCRHVLRATAAPWLACEPADIALRFGPHGKPFFDHDTDLQFNISHTRGAALLAFARGPEIGVDIENITRHTDLDGVARKVFTEHERTTLAPLEGETKSRQFFRLWTAKEAFLKATGRGLSLDPASIETALPNEPDGLGSFESPLEPATNSLSLRELTLASPFTAALCAPPAMLASPLNLTHEK